MDVEIDSQAKSVARALEAKMTKAFLGVSTCIDLYECNADLIRSEVHIREYVEKVCELINIKPYGACHVVHIGKNQKEAGFSMFQFIETSWISAHFVDETNTAYIDIFCCKPYDEEKAAIFTEEFFEAKYRRIQKNIRR